MDVMQKGKKKVLKIKWEEKEEKKEEEAEEQKGENIIYASVMYCFFPLSPYPSTRHSRLPPFYTFMLKLLITFPLISQLLRRLIVSLSTELFLPRLSKGICYNESVNQTSSPTSFLWVITLFWQIFHTSLLWTLTQVSRALHSSHSQEIGSRNTSMPDPLPSEPSVSHLQGEKEHIKFLLVIVRWHKDNLVIYVSNLTESKTFRCCR